MSLRWLLFSGLDVKLINWARGRRPEFSRTLPPLPEIRRVDAELRRINRETPAGETTEVWLYCEGAGWPGARWQIGGSPSLGPHALHSESVPGGGEPGSFDVIGAAQRLLAAARQAGFDAPQK